MGDVPQYCDLDNPVVSVGGKPQEGRRRVSIDMSGEMITRLDAQAVRHDVPRQALIKMWPVERLDKEEKRACVVEDAAVDSKLPQDAFRQVGREGRGGQVCRLPPRERLRVLHLPFVKRRASVVSGSLFEGPCADAARFQRIMPPMGADGHPGVVGMNPRYAGDILPPRWVQCSQRSPRVS